MEPMRAQGAQPKRHQSANLSNLSDLALCQTAKVNLYTLAMNCQDSDVADRALFLLSEMELYDEQTLPTPTRRRQIEKFLRACQSLRERLESTCGQIPELCDTH
jgi:hypothetical protein